MTVLQAVLRESYKYASNRELWRNPRQKNAESNKMTDKPLIAQTFVQYGYSLAVIAHYIADTRVAVADCIKKASFTNKVIEAVCICKFVGTSFGVDAVSATRKMMGARALLEESRLGASSFVCNATCAAEGDNTIMELKIVGDLVKAGYLAMFPFGLLFRTFLISSECRRLVYFYLYCIFRAIWLNKAALKEGQLLRDIAWCRAHMLILTSFATKGGLKYGDNVKSMRESYEQLMLRFPVPTQF
jgi:hypothetical protein